MDFPHSPLGSSLSLPCDPMLLDEGGADFLGAAEPVLHMDWAAGSAPLGKPFLALPPGPFGGVLPCGPAAPAPAAPAPAALRPRRGRPLPPGSHGLAGTRGGNPAPPPQHQHQQQHGAANAPLPHPAPHPGSFQALLLQDDDDDDEPPPLVVLPPRALRDRSQKSRAAVAGGARRSNSSRPRPRRSAQAGAGGSSKPVKPRHVKGAIVGVMLMVARRGAHLKQLSAAVDMEQQAAMPASSSSSRMMTRQRAAAGPSAPGREAAQQPPGARQRVERLAAATRAACLSLQSELLLEAQDMEALDPRQDELKNDCLRAGHWIDLSAAARSSSSGLAAAAGGGGAPAAAGSQAGTDGGQTAAAAAAARAATLAVAHWEAAYASCMQEAVLQCGEDAAAAARLARQMQRDVAAFQEQRRTAQQLPAPAAAAAATVAAAESAAAASGPREPGPQSSAGGSRASAGGAAAAGAPAAAAAAGDGGTLPAPGPGAARPYMVRAAKNGGAPVLLTREGLQQCFTLTEEQAAQQLGVSVSTLKQYQKHLGITRWPHRTLGSIDRLMRDVQASQAALGAAGNEDETAEVLQTLRAFRGKVLADPNLKVDDDIKTLRARHARLRNKEKSKQAGKKRSSSGGGGTTTGDGSRSKRRRS